jgi:hypothetical protein
MAKELPYFKFEPSEWQNGNIQMCSELAQLYFINMCCVYWTKLGELSYRFTLIKCFKNNEDLLIELIENKIITVENDNIVIFFLDKQLGELKIKRKISSESGRKGGINNGIRPEIERLVGNQLYLLECWNSEERFYKMGITTSSISRRYSGKIQYQYKVVFQVFTDRFSEAERYLCEALRNYEYNPLLNFAGQKECYLYSENQAIENIINNYFDFAKASLQRTDAIREEESKEDKNKEKKFNPTNFLLENMAESDLIKEWFVVRKTKKLANTKTALEDFITELNKSNMGINEVLKYCIIKGWGGFKYSWILNDATKNQLPQATRKVFNPNEHYS